jgi:hypothetical protein
MLTEGSFIVFGLWLGTFSLLYSLAEHIPKKSTFPGGNQLYQQFAQNAL